MKKENKLIKQVFEKLNITEPLDYITICHVSSPEWGCVSYTRLDEDLKYNHTEIIEFVKVDELHNHINEIYTATDDIKKLINKICKLVIDEDEFDDSIRGDEYVLKIYSDGDYEWDDNE